MVLFMILLVTLVLLTVFTVLVAGAGGAIFTILFSDVIVCIFIIGWIMKRLFRKKK